MLSASDCGHEDRCLGLLRTLMEVEYLLANEAEHRLESMIEDVGAIGGS